MKPHKYPSGFTIVELLIVIVVIGILAAIAIVSYTNLSTNALATALQSDLKQAQTELGIRQVEDGVFPEDTTRLVRSTGTAYQYTRASDGSSYCLSAYSAEHPSNTSLQFHVSHTSGGVQQGLCVGHVVDESEPIAVTPESCFAFTAETRTITDYYDHEDNSTSNPACPRDVNIPSSIGGVGVEVIGAMSFSAKSLTSATIPNSVTDVLQQAFYDNHLVSVTIGDSVTTIGIGAFYQNALTSVNIPNSVIAIEPAAFLDNSLTSLTLGNSVVDIGSYAFGGSKITSLIIPNSVTAIGEQAFFENSLTSLTIGNSVTTIGTAAFYKNSLTSVVIPNSVITIEPTAFGSNSITSLTIGNSVTTIQSSAFSNNQLSSVVIPDSVITIEHSAFRDNNLNSVIMGSSVTSIGARAFKRNSLSTVSIPTGATYITSGSDATFDDAVIVDTY